ncbi:MAG: hypothetical protein AABX14_03085 [Candidatus Aenigmatarchaeota archaeon]
MELIDIAGKGVCNAFVGKGTRPIGRGTIMRCVKRYAQEHYSQSLTDGGTNLYRAAEKALQVLEDSWRVGRTGEKYAWIG